MSPVRSEKPPFAATPACANVRTRAHLLLLTRGYPRGPDTDTGAAGGRLEERQPMRILATGGTEGSGLAAELVPLDDPEAVAAGLRQAIASGARREEMRRMEAEHVSRFAWA